MSYLPRNHASIHQLLDILTAVKCLHLNCSPLNYDEYWPVTTRNNNKFYYKRAPLTRRTVPRNFKVMLQKQRWMQVWHGKVQNTCSTFSNTVQACEKPCLQSPLKYCQWWRRRDDKWQTVPYSCRRDRKRAVTNRRVLHLRNDKRRRVCWSKLPPRIIICNWTVFSREVQWCSNTYIVMLCI